ncbi:MAG: hypothetical protein IPG45_27590 [Deltaproteobacteria bacterium]|nr:hypothetical protein [Deltaproteobacteria bacterium]
MNRIKVPLLAGCALCWGLSACRDQGGHPPPAPSADPGLARGTQGTLAVVGKATSPNYVLQFEVGPGGSGGRAEGGGFQLTVSLPEGR